MEGFPSSDNEVSDKDVFSNIPQNSDFDQDVTVDESETDRAPVASTSST